MREFPWCLGYSALSNPFPVPKFCASMEENFSKRVLTDADRKYMVQTLATMLMLYVSDPSLKHCGVAAKALITTFDFLKDDESDVEVSYMHG